MHWRLRKPSRADFLGDEGGGIEDEEVVGKRAADGGLQGVLNSLKLMVGKLQQVIESYI